MPSEPKITVHFPTHELVRIIKLMAKRHGHNSASSYCKDLIMVGLHDRGIVDRHGCINHEMLKLLVEEEEVNLHKLFPEQEQNEPEPNEQESNEQEPDSKQ